MGYAHSYSRWFGYRELVMVLRSKRRNGCFCSQFLLALGQYHHSLGIFQTKKTMITSLLFLEAYAFYILYSTSQRAELTLKDKCQKYFHTHQRSAQYMGSGLLLLLLISYITLWGVAGAFAWLAALMAMGSLIVLLLPMRLFFTYYIIAIFSGILLIELYFTYASK